MADIPPAVIDVQRKCRLCGGKGVINTGGGQKVCPRCHGTGIEPRGANTRPQMPEGMA